MRPAVTLALSMALAALPAGASAGQGPEPGVREFVDLWVVDVELSRSGANPGDPVTATALVANVGGKAAAGFTVRFYASQGSTLEPVSAHDLGGLAPNASVEVQSEPWLANNGVYQGNLEAQRHDLWAIASLHPPDVESNTENNQASRSLAVAPERLVAVEPDGEARGFLAVSGRGPATGAIAVSGAGAASAATLSASALGSSRAIFHAASVLGDARACHNLPAPPTSCPAVSVFGDARSTSYVAVSVTGDAASCHGLGDGCVAVSGTGHADGDRAVSGCDALSRLGVTLACVDPL